MPARPAPESEEPSTDYRVFTLEEANRTLPLVRRIVGDIVRAYPAFREKLQEFDRLASGADVDATRDRLQELREAIDRDSEQINRFIAELHQIGCLFKGFEDGLVDFYGRLDGRPVFLCWKLGEDAVAYYHEVDEGFSGRKPIG